MYSQELLVVFILKLNSGIEYFMSNTGIPFTKQKQKDMVPD